MMGLRLGLGFEKRQASSSGPIYAALSKPAFQGDSITRQGMVVTTNGLYYAIGWINWMNTLLNGRFDFQFANNQAVSGDTVQTQKADLEGGILDGKDFDCYFLMIGTNNYGDDIPTTVGLVEEMIDYVIAEYNVPCFLFHIIHTDDGTRNTWVDDYNDALDGIGTKGGMLHIIPINTYFDTVDISVATSDGIHPQEAGAYLMGKLAAEELRPLFGDAALPDFAGSSNLLANGSMAGTGGTAGTGTSGSVATSWTTTGGGGGPTRVMSKVSGTDDQKMSIAATGLTTQADPYMQLSQTVSSGFTTGEVYIPYALIEVLDSPAPQNVLYLRLLTSKSGTGLTNPNAVYANYNTNSTTTLGQPHNSIAGIGEFLLRGPEITIDAGVTSLLYTIRLGGNGSTTPARAPTADIVIKAAGLMRVA